MARGSNTSRAVVERVDQPVDVLARVVDVEATRAPWRPRPARASAAARSGGRRGCRRPRGRRARRCRAGGCPRSSKEHHAAALVGVGRARRRAGPRPRAGAPARRRSGRARGRAPCPCRSRRGSRSAAPRPTASAIARGAGLELPGQLVPGRRARRSTREIMCAAAEERRHRLEQLAAPVQHADAGGAERLVAGPGVEVGVDRRAGRPASAAPPARRRSAPPRRPRGRGGDLGDRVDRAEHVRHVRDADQLHACRSASTSSSSSSDELRRPRTRAGSAAWRPCPRQASCQGTMFEWCSISVTSTSSPGPRFSRPQA